MAVAIGHGLTEQGVRVRYFPTTALVQQVQLAREQLHLEQALSRLDRYAVLIPDDFGYVKKNEHETRVLFALIAHQPPSTPKVPTPTISDDKPAKIPAKIIVADRPK